MKTLGSYRSLFRAALIVLVMTAALLYALFSAAAEEASAATPSGISFTPVSSEYSIGLDDYEDMEDETGESYQEYMVPDPSDGDVLSVRLANGTTKKFTYKDDDFYDSNGDAVMDVFEAEELDWAFIWDEEQSSTNTFAPGEKHAFHMCLVQDEEIILKDATALYCTIGGGPEQYPEVIRYESAVERYETDECDPEAEDEGGVIYTEYLEPDPAEGDKLYVVFRDVDGETVFTYTDGEFIDESGKTLEDHSHSASFGFVWTEPQSSTNQYEIGKEYQLRAELTYTSDGEEKVIAAKGEFNCLIKEQGQQPDPETEYVLTGFSYVKDDPAPFELFEFEDGAMEGETPETRYFEYDTPYEDEGDKILLKFTGSDGTEKTEEYVYDPDENDFTGESGSLFDNGYEFEFVWEVPQSKENQYQGGKKYFYIPTITYTDDEDEEHALAAAEKLEALIVSDGSMALSDGMIFYIDLDDKKAYVVQADDIAIGTECVIPSKVTGKNGKEYTVAGIDCGAFEEFDKIKSVYIPDSVVEIWDDAFAGCTSLESVRLPNTLVEIGADAFCDTALKEIAIPLGTTKIGAHAFGFARTGSDDEYTYSKADGFVVRAGKDTAGQRYAEKYGFTLESPDEEQKQYAIDLAKKAKTKIVKVKPLSRKVKVTWSKVKNAGGYIVYKATKKTGRYKKVKVIKKGSTVSLTVTKLKKGKKYFVKVRPYTMVDGVKYEGKLSAAKAVKAK